MMLVFGLAIVIGMVYLMRSFKQDDTKGPVSSARSSGAREVLDSRYLSGELSRDEYLVLKEILEKQSNSE